MIPISLTILMMVADSCSEEKFDLDKPNVGQFVSILKEGSYAEKIGYELPKFTMNDIGELLKYVDDTTVIVEYPMNPISSKLTLPKILNECLMWTIEGIRLDQKYVSLEPSLIDITAYKVETGYPRLTNKQLIVLSEKYINWYNEFRINPTETLRKKDLIDSTKYRWN